MAKLFTASSGVPSRMKLLSATGIFFSIAQTALILGARPASWRTMSALLLYIGALSLFWWAVPQAEKSRLNIAFTDKKPETLLADGPYRYVRHPFYASYLLYWVAGALISDWMWASVVVMGSFYLAALRQEEESFRSSHLADCYETYKKRTGALVPLWYVSKRKQCGP